MIRFAAGRLRVFVLWLVVLVGAASSASAQPSASAVEGLGPSAADQALAFMETGTKLFRAGDFVGALRAFEQAASIVPDRPNPYRWMGLTMVRLDRCPDAVAAFNRFLSLVPTSDTRTVEAETLRDRCRSELAPKLGTLVVDSAPAGAEVRLGGAQGTLLGQTPVRQDSVAVGSHLVHLSSSGFADALREVHVGRNETVSLKVDLMPLPKPHRRRTGLIVGTVVGSVVVVGLALGLGLGLGLRSNPETLPPVVSPLSVP